ncbi:hypothetical protein NA57DRAFT_61668 [Rhizodiscina lignyota]|uniref:Zn(2)-C6 fungal-type domain-containing protein n=1 Tax=Rhizodiscina lignyota TaxID=1504668 RepID=A0A9P4M187_9PEZI|nr:hypothetical protein NA57DRAFT_61668 [Rhizodiscina lignyota]
MAPGYYQDKRSKACEPCRARHVKCDEVKPACERCIKAKRSCTYRDLFEISIRDQNSAAARKAQVAWRQRVKPARSSSDASISSKTPSPPNEMAVASDVYPALTEDRLYIVSCRFLFDFTIPSYRSDQFRGVMDHLPDLYLYSHPDSALRTAVAATSYINFFRRSPQPRMDDKITASKYYTQALARLQNELKYEEMARSDELLTAVYLMGIYEVSSPEHVSKRYSLVPRASVSRSLHFVMQTMSAGTSRRFIETHAQGLAVLLRIRKPPMSDTGQSFKSWLTANFQLLLYCLLLGRPSFIEYEPFREVYENSHFVLVRLMGLIHKTADLLPAFHAHLNSSDETSRYSYMQRLYALERELLYWHSTRGQNWMYEGAADLLGSQPSFLKNLTKLPGAPDHFNMIAINCSILKTKGPQIGEYDELYSEEGSLWTIRELFDEICASVYAYFIVSIAGRTAAMDTSSIIGLRQFFLMMPMRMSMGYIQTLQINPIPMERWSWAQQVLTFLLHLNHTGRPG